MNTSSIQQTYSDTVITYDEQENKWRFTLRGRDRSAESLAKAKEIIDKPVPAEKAKPFEKIPAWLFPYNDMPKRVEVTGIAESPSYRNTVQVWINQNGTRSKEEAPFRIFPSNEKNDAIVAEVIEKRKVAERLRKEGNDLQQKLSPLVLPKDE